jgi:transcriptional regulator GlxA family with amidase domain
VHGAGRALVVDLVRRGLRDLGAQLALEDVQREVDPARRPARGEDVAVVDHARLEHLCAGVAQFVERPLSEAQGDGLATTRAWMLERLGEPLTVADMARHAGYSARSFARRFAAETGTSPLRWLIGQRVEHARRLLEGTDLPVEHVAERAGFGTATALRQHFARALATSPTAYRRAFRAA